MWDKTIRRWVLEAIALIACLGVAYPKPVTPEARVDGVTAAMGTTYTIEMYGTDRISMNSAMNQAFEEVHRLDNLLSNYIPDSEVSRVNQDAANGPVKISRELFRLLERCTDDSRRSDGTFDITVGPLMQVWGFYRDSGHLASRAAVQKAMQSVGWQNIVLDPINLSIRFTKPGVNLDLGGVGKGYAVDRMVRVLRQRGVRSSLVSAGSSSIYGIGVPPNRPQGWRIQIRDPRNEKGTVGQVYLKNTSISTSGGYEKFFWADGRMYSHIMDPRTGFPSRGVLSVSVVAPATIDSEIWAKPYYILGRSWTLQHKQKQFRVFLCEDRKGADCSWLY